MPLIQISAAKNTLNKDEQDALISQVSDAVLKSEGADPEDPAAQALVWGYYSESPEVYVGGKNPEKAPLTIAVTTPEGALDNRARKTLVQDIGVVVDDLLGQFENRLNHWAMLYELDERSWGGSGQIFRLADIQAAMNIKPDDH